MVSGTGAAMMATKDRAVRQYQAFHHQQQNQFDNYPPQIALPDGEERRCHHHTNYTSIDQVF